MPGRRSAHRRPRSRQTRGRSLVGTQLTLEIGNVAHGGFCVARADGRVVFVRHTLPGEQVVATVTEGDTESRFLRADATQILVASPERRSAPCPYAGPGLCGGCDWQHTSAAYGRVLKAQVVAEQLRRLATLDVPVTVEPVPGDSDGLRWRTRVELAAAAPGRAGVRLGIRKHRSHEVLPVDDCLIAVEDVTATAIFTEVFDEGISGADVAVGSDETVVVELPNHDPVPSLRQEVLDRSFQVSARGFWQVHPGAASTFASVVLSALDPQPGDHVLDLYCGVGLFTAFLAAAAGPSGRVLGVEGDARAVHDAQDNIPSNATVVRSDVEAFFESGGVESELGAVDLLVLDPPRAGAGRAVMQAALARRPRRAAYVACDPAALARDLAYAAEHGYRLASLRAFDAFPMTHHVECIAILEPDARGTTIDGLV